MVFLLALGAALANALTSVFQRMGVEDAPADKTLKLSLMTYAVRRGIWLLGFALMIVSFILQAVALHFGQLSQVQPILTLELVFLVAVLSVWLGFTVGRREWLGSLACVGGLAGFLLLRPPRGGQSLRLLLELGDRRGRLQRRASPWPSSWRCVGPGGGVRPCSAPQAPSASPSPQPAPRWSRTTPQQDWTSLYRHGQTYALIFFGALAVFLTQNAFHAGPIVASQSTLVMVDPLASILIGVGLFSDDLRTGGAWGPLEAISLLVMFLGAFSLAHSPLVSGMKGDDDQYHELLSQRSRAEQLASNAPPPLSPS